MNKLLPKRFSIATILLSVFSVQQWLGFTVTLTFISWTLDFYIIYMILRFKSSIGNGMSNYVQSFDLKLLKIYFIWMLFNSIRGVFIAENYWEYKQLITGILALSIPVFVYVFSIPCVVQMVLRYWFKYALLIFVAFIPFLATSAYHFYLGPLFVIGCFIPMLPKKWKIIIGGLLIIMLFINLGARSQVIKSAVVLLVAVGIYFKRFVSESLLRFIHWACYVVPIILLTLGITGTFNIFQDMSSNEGKYVTKTKTKGQTSEEDLSADTRTFIYVEVLSSAVKHNYVLWGRTPARGNDSMFFGSYNAEDLKTGKYERHANELCHTNVFTWLGLIGVVIYGLIYLRSSYLAVYKSSNIYIKFIGCFIAFRWAYGWVEDFNRFDIMNLSLWMLIAILLSRQFRFMTNQEFVSFIKSIFTKQIKTRKLNFSYK